MKVYLYTHDPMLTLVRSEQETLELFGDDFDGFMEIPDELAEDLISTYKTLSLSDQAAKLKEKHEDATSKRRCHCCGRWKTNVKGKRGVKMCEACFEEK